MARYKRKREDHIGGLSMNNVPQLFLENSTHDKRVHEAVGFLRFKGLIRAGSIISGQIVEEALQLRWENEGDWKFIGPLRLLFAKIEAMGFFVSQKKIKKPGFKILHSDEMAEHAKKKLMRNMISNYKVAYIMATHDTSKMTEEERRYHESMTKKSAQIANVQQKALLENQFF